MSAPANWYPDPQDPTRLRYFDGNAWTEHTSPAAPPEPAPAAVPQWLDGGFDAPASAPAGGPASVGDDSVARLSVGASLGYGWKKLTEYPAMILLVLGCVGLFVLFGLPLYLLSSPESSSSWFGLVLVATLFAWSVPLAGLYRGGLAVVNGEPPSVSMIFRTERLVPFALTLALVGFITALCYPIGSVLFVFLVFAPLITLDKGLNPFQAITASFRLVKSHFFTTVLILWVLEILTFCLFLTVLPIPIALVGFVYYYRALSDESVAA